MRHTIELDDTIEVAVPVIDTPQEKVNAMIQHLLDVVKQLRTLK